MGLSDFPLSTSYSRFPHSAFRLPTSYFRLLTVLFIWNLRGEYSPRIHTNLIRRIRDEWYSPITQMIGRTFAMDSPRIHWYSPAIEIGRRIRGREFAVRKSANSRWGIRTSRNSRSYMPVTLCRTSTGSRPTFDCVSYPLHYDLYFSLWSLKYSETVSLLKK